MEEKEYSLRFVCAIVENGVSLIAANGVPSELAACIAVIGLSKEGHEGRVDFFGEVAGLETATAFGEGKAGAFLGIVSIVARMIVA